MSETVSETVSEIVSDKFKREWVSEFEFEVSRYWGIEDQIILVKYEEDSRKDSVLGKLLLVSENHIEIMNNKMESIRINQNNYITSKLIYKG